MRGTAGNKKSIFPNHFISQLATGFGFCLFSRRQCSSVDFLCRLKTTSGGRELSLNLPSSLHCAHVFVTVKQPQSQPNPNLSLVKISHFLFPPILSKLSTAEQSALLDQICRRFSCDIPGSQSLDYTIKVQIFAFESFKPSSKHKHATYALGFMKTSKGS